MRIEMNSDYVTTKVRGNKTGIGITNMSPKTKRCFHLFFEYQLPHGIGSFRRSRFLMQFNFLLTHGC